ncbi:MAG: hypothetical protein IPL55_02405 [Saprospiraceae bacterium]|jgi:hypothetical protein|nr:hypothetical protein [Saprospiraceae bacterium]
MKKDKLERFIESNRDAFDDKMPDRSIWLSIENDLNKNERNLGIYKINILKIAASVILILGVGVIIGFNLKSKTNNIDYARSPELMQLKDTEAYYKMQVSNKLNQVNDPASKVNVTQDLKQLDEVYLQLKEEIISSGYSNSDILIQAMIKNYRTKVDILENILNKQNQIKNENLSL